MYTYIYMESCFYWEIDALFMYNLQNDKYSANYQLYTRIYHFYHILCQWTHSNNYHCNLSEQFESVSKFIAYNICINL